MKTIIITGSSGFLGKNLIKSTKNLGYHCIEYSRSNQGLNESILSFIKNQINNSNHKIVGLIHCIGSFENNLDKDFQSNVVIAWNLLSSIKELNLNIPIVLIGSAAEYGLVKEEDNPISEEQICKPISIHGFTKYLQTQIAQFFTLNFDLDIKIVRVFNLSGKDASRRLFVGRLHQIIQEWKLNKLNNFKFGNLDSKRDYLDVELASEYIIKILFKGKKGEIYNLGSGEAVKMSEFLYLKLKEEGVDPSLVSPYQEKEFLKKNDVPIIYADISKLKMLLDERDIIE